MGLYTTWQQLAALATALALLHPTLAKSQEIDCYGAVVEVAVLPEGGTVARHVYGYPAAFGAILNVTATSPFALEAASPISACGEVAPAAPAGGAALVLRGNCTFAEKAWALQRAGYAAMVLFSNGTDECVVMSTDTTSEADITLAAVSITAEAGAVLQALLQSGSVSLTLRQPPIGRADPAALLLWLLAVGTVAAGAVWAGADSRQRGIGGVSAGSAIRREETASITPNAALAFVFVSSAVLLLLFFVHSAWVALIIVALFCLAAWQATSAALLAVLHRMAPAAWERKTLQLPHIATLQALPSAASATAAALTAAWFVCRRAHWAWALQDVLSVCLMLLLLRTLHLPNLKVACILLPGALLYDVWWVFLQPLVTGGPSVMVEVATGGTGGLQLPMLLAVPLWQGLGTNPALEILGLGDIVLPGLLVAFARRWDLARSRRRLHSLSAYDSVPAAGGEPNVPVTWRSGYFLPAVGAYGIGLIVTFLALLASLFGDHGQPALLYLVPCTLGTVCALAWRRGDFVAMWSCDLGHGDEATAGGSGDVDGLEAGQGPADSLLQPDSP